MTSSAITFLTHRGYSPRDIKALKTEMADLWTKQPKNPGTPARSASGLKYVHYTKRGVYEVYIKHEGEMIYCGTTRDIHEAPDMQWRMEQTVKSQITAKSN